MFCLMRDLPLSHTNDLSCFPPPHSTSGVCSKHCDVLPRPLPTFRTEDILSQLEPILLPVSCQPPALPGIITFLRVTHVQWLVNAGVSTLSLLTPTQDNSQRPSELQIFQAGPTEAFVERASQDWAQGEVGLLPSFPSADLDSKSTPKTYPRH